MTVGLAAAGVNSYLDSLGFYVKLHTGDPGASGATAAAAGSTTRVQATMASASGGSKSLSSIGNWTNGGTNETLSHISGWSAATAGTFSWSAALTTSKAWASGDTFTLTSLTISISPIAAQTPGAGGDAVSGDASLTAAATLNVAGDASSSAITHGQQVGPSNTGIAGAGISEGSLTSTGATTYSTNGQTITGRRFTGTVTVTGSNVTLSGCLFDAPSGSNQKAVVVQGSGVTLVDCTIRVSGGGSIYMGVECGASGLTVCRCDISGGENDLTLYGDGFLLTESYVHGSSNVSNPSGHRDTVEVYGGSGVIERCRMIHPVGETATVNVAPWAGAESVDYLHLYDNFLDGGNRTVLVDLQSSGHIHNVKVKRNVFGGHNAFTNYDPLQNNDGRAIVATDAAQAANLDAILWPSSGADANTWGECSDLSPNRTGQFVVV